MHQVNHFHLSFVPLFLLGYNSHSSPYFESVQFHKFSIFKRLCDHHHSNSSKFSPSPKESPYSLAVTLRSPLA